MTLRCLRVSTCGETPVQRKLPCTFHESRSQPKERQQQLHFVNAIDSEIIAVKLYASCIFTQPPRALHQLNLEPVPIHPSRRTTGSKIIRFRIQILIVKALVESEWSYPWICQRLDTNGSCMLTGLGWVGFETTQISLAYMTGTRWSLVAWDLRFLSCLEVNWA